jgi:hypothetical protein
MYYDTYNAVYYVMHVCIVYSIIYNEVITYYNNKIHMNAHKDINYVHPTVGA